MKVDIRAALQEEIAETQERLDALKAALRALGGNGKSHPRKRPVEQAPAYEGNAAATILTLIEKNFDAQQDIPAAKVSVLAGKHYQMPKGTVSSGLWKLKSEGWVKRTGKGIYRLTGKK